MKKKFSIISFVSDMTLGMVIIGGMDYFIKNRLNLIWMVIGISLMLSFEKIGNSKHDE